MYELEKDEQRFTAVVLVEVCVCYSIIYMYVVDEYKHNTSSQEVIITQQTWPKFQWTEFIENYENV